MSHMWRYERSCAVREAVLGTERAQELVKARGKEEGRHGQRERRRVPWRKMGSEAERQRASDRALDNRIGSGWVVVGLVECRARLCLLYTSDAADDM
eukprot:3247215-Rhodomonas_salina.4